MKLALYIIKVASMSVRAAEYKMFQDFSASSS